MRALAMLASLAAVVVAALCAAVVALAVVILRALDARGVDLAGAILDAMGAARPARRDRVVRVVVQQQRAAQQGAQGAPNSREAPVNRRRVRSLSPPRGRPCVAVMA